MHTDYQQRRQQIDTRYEQDVAALTGKNAHRTKAASSTDAETTDNYELARRAVDIHNGAAHRALDQAAKQTHDAIDQHERKHTGKTKAAADRNETSDEE